MKIKFEPSGTHVQKGFLKVRLDFYPDVTDKTYASNYVYVPVEPPGGYPGKVDEYGDAVDRADYDRYVANLPRIWKLTPPLSYFIVVSETVSELTEYIHTIFHKDTVKSLDDALISLNRAHLLQPLLRDKGRMSNEKEKTGDIADLIASVNARFADLMVPLDIGGESIPLDPQSIDVGGAATDRPAGGGNADTQMSTENPANATGTITQFDIWVTLDCDNTSKLGTFYGTVPDMTPRDFEAVGVILTGAMRSFAGLDCDVQTNDLAGSYHDKGIEESTGTAFDYYWLNGDQFGAGQQTYTKNAGEAMSLYGTGTEAGWANIAKVGGVTEANLGKMNTVDKANIAKIQGVAV